MPAAAAGRLRWAGCSAGVCAYVRVGTLLWLVCSPAALRQRARDRWVRKPPPVRVSCVGWLSSITLSFISHARTYRALYNVSHCHNSTGANSGAGTRRRTNRHWQAHGAPGHVVERRTWRSHVRSVQQRAAAPSGASTWRLPRPTQRCSRIARESWRSQQERRNVSSRAPADGALQVRRTSIVATLISDQRARKEARRPWKARATT